MYFRRLLLSMRLLRHFVPRNDTSVLQESGEELAHLLVRMIGVTMQPICVDSRLHLTLSSRINRSRCGVDTMAIPNKITGAFLIISPDHRTTHQY